jgi:dihydropyrimidinase
MEHDLVVRNARIIMPNDVVSGDLGITDGKIAAIGDDVSPGTIQIDARGKILLPGGIDSHCHLAQQPVNGEPVCPDDFETASCAAAAGGTTTIIPFSMCPRGADQAQTLATYLALGHNRSLIDYGVHLQMPEADPAFLSTTLPKLAQQGFTSLKIFTTYEGYALADTEILSVMRAAAALNLLCIIHCEDDALVRHLTSVSLNAGDIGLSFQPKVRAMIAEAEMIHRMGNYAIATGARIHIFHVTGAAALTEVARAKARGARISAETCPHYLTFSAQDLARPNFEGAKFLCAPALRTPTDQAALWHALCEDCLSIVSSDHSPSHRLDQIARANAGEVIPFTGFSGGIPGIQTMLAVLFSEGVSRGRISLSRFAELTAQTPAHLFGMPDKGEITVGRDADLTLWDPDATWTIRHADMLSAVDFTPWEGWEMTGRPVMTISRGRIVMRDGRVDRSALGHGRLLPRQGVPT